jgi:hypothetical protein
MHSFAESAMQIVQVHETNRFAAVDDNGVLTTVIEFTGGVRQALLSARRRTHLRAITGLR